MNTKLLYIVLIFVCQIFSIHAFSQQIKGMVTDIDFVPLEYFNVEILHKTDSSTIKGGTFANGKFVFDKLENGKYLLKLSSLGYSNLIVETETNTESNYTFQLEKNEIYLDEVIVTSRLPRIIHKEDRFIIEIENSSLSNAGNAIDALGRTPFVIIDKLNGEITVAGKGNSIILINNRKITNRSELEMLNSQNIKQIDVIENPSAKYEAEGHSVINIITRKNHEMGINANLQTNYTRGRHNSGKILSGLTYVTDKLLLFSQYGYNHRNNEGFNSSDERFEKESYSFYIKQSNLKNLYQTRINNYSFGINYNPVKNHSLSIKYDGFSGNVVSNTVNQIQASRNMVNIPTEILNENGKNKLQNDGINLNYNFSNNGYEVSIIGDYTSSKKNSAVKLHETNADKTQYANKEYNWNAVYDLFSSQIDVKLPIAPISSSLELGIRASYVESQNNSEFMYLLDNTYIKDNQFSNIIAFNETIIGSYLLLSGKINNKTQYKAGIRYEHVANENKWISVETSNAQTIQNSLFPSLLITRKVNDNLQFRLSYSKRISRPSYETLNNNLVYKNSYSVTQGNPYLKPAIYNTLSFASQIKKINLSINISHIKSPNDLLYLNDSIQIEKYTCKRINTEDRWSFVLNGNYSYTYKKWTVQPFFNITFCERSIIEDGVKYSTNYPGMYLSFRNNIALSKSMDIDCDLTYYKSSHSFKTFVNQYEFNLSLRKKLLKDRLTFQLSCNYIPKKWKQLLDYSYKYIDFTWDGDDRKQIIISIQYNFNTAKRQFKSKASNEEELNRL
jgi:hypothetical protein